MPSRVQWTDWVSFELRGAKIALVSIKAFVNLREMMRAVVWLCQLVLVSICATPHSFGDDTNAAPVSIPATNAAAVELRGQLVPLSEKSNERVGLRTESGIVYS